MISENLYKYLLSWLVPAMEEEFHRRYFEKRYEMKLRRLGRTDKYVYQSRVDKLRTILRALICPDKDKKILVDASRRFIYAYNGVCFIKIDDKLLFLKELFKRAFVELEIGEKYNDEFPAKQIAETCLDTLSSSDKFLYTPNRRFVAFRNLIYDIDLRKPVEPKAEQCPAIVLDLEYRDKDDIYRECANLYGFNNPCKLWDDKIREIIPNKDARSVFQQWCGTLLADKEKYKSEYVLFLIGPGSNGKSVISNVIAKVFGEEYFSCFSLRQLFKDNDRNVNIAALQGKVANFIDDIDSKELSGGDFKRFASGGEFQGRGMYEKRVVKVKAPSLLCCGNTMPETDDDSYGGHRRRLVVHTTQVAFVGDKRDTKLTYKLTRNEALLYVFHWIVDGYKLFTKNDGEIYMGDDMIKSQDAVIACSNNMRRWWADGEYIALKSYDAKHWHSLIDTYAEYKNFAESEGSRPHERGDLSKMLTEKGCYKLRKGIGYGYCYRRADDIDTSMNTDVN